MNLANGEIARWRDKFFYKERKRKREKEDI
jgi:hypothetical protein